MTQTLKILTLNCWGVFTPLACEYRHERIRAIGKQLAQGDHDVALLQEVWTQADYKQLCDDILPAMPYTHYFHSGLFGSGLCVFSKHRIVDTFQFRFPLNGYAHKVHHGDWFGGKSVGLVKILFGVTRVNVYVTHLHAQYSAARDEYLAHRVTQAFQLSQFVRNTSELCDVVIVGGDFNLEATHLGHLLIRANAGLDDAWLKQKDKDNLLKNGATCDHPDNTFTTKQQLAINPLGIRLDYVLFRSNPGYSIECDRCAVLVDKVPGQLYHFSDHEAVAAVFTVKKNIIAEASPARHPAAIQQHLAAALPVLAAGERKVKADQLFFAVCAVLCLVFLLYTSRLQLHVVFSALLIAMRLAATVGLAFCAWTAVVMVNWEVNVLTETRKDINNVLKSLFPPSE